MNGLTCIDLNSILGSVGKNERLRTYRFELCTGFIGKINVCHVMTFF